MATVSKWTPFGVALDITATGGTVTRTSATQFTVAINVSWETYYSGAETNYGMSATAGGVTKTISSFGTARSGGSGSFTGTFSISGNGSSTKTITVTFKNFNTDNGNSASKSVSFNVTVPAWTSYAVKYNANGGTGAPSQQTKWKNQTLTLSSTKPIRTGYTFKNWNTASGGTGTAYASGASYTANASVTLYAQWTAITYKVTFNANGGTGAPAQQTKTYGVNLTLSSTKPTRSGYTFKGWATTSTATAATYAAGGTYAANAAITLYAVWELSYKEPKITNVSIKRCTVNQNPSEDGTYALVQFDWSTSSTVTSITVTYTDSDGVSGTTGVTASGTSGKSVRVLTGGGKLSPSNSYTISITVKDSGGTTTISKTLNGKVYPFGVLPRHKGVSFGKKPELEGYADFGYKTKHRKEMEFENNTAIFGTRPDGTIVEAFNINNANGNLVIGYGNYEKADGRQTNIYSYDMNFGVSNIANPGTYRPYRRRGDSMTISLRTTGYITNAKKDLSFWIPFSVPIVGSPTVTVACGNGFQLRQGDKYICGSTATVYAIPTSMEATATMFNGVYVKAVFSDTTNVLNNDTVGVFWHGTITFT